MLPRPTRPKASSLIALAVFAVILAAARMEAGRVRAETGIPMDAQAVFMVGAVSVMLAALVAGSLAMILAAFGSRPAPSGKGRT